MSPLSFMRALLAALSLLALNATAQTPPAATLRHAVVQFDGEGLLTLVTTAPAPAQGDVLLQYPGRQGMPACCRRLPLSSFKPVALAPGAATDMVSDQPLVALQARVPKKDAEMPFVGAAVLGDVASARLGRGGGLMATARDGRTATSTTCLSSEGFHVIAKGAAHLYVNLGYDIEESTCR